jgi:poly(3-hydroxybutyrate) depolymerase
MLYQVHEMQRAALKPLVAWAKAALPLLSAPVGPFHNAPLAAGCELLYRLGKDYNKPRFEIDTTEFAGQTLAVCESVVATKSFCRLLHFAKQFEGAAPERIAHPVVLLVAPLSGHYATLLRETVKGLLHEHDVYITDWTDACQVPLADGDFGLPDYVAYVQDFLRLLGPEVHVVAICQPTVAVLGSVALMASDGQYAPRSMTLMGGPIDGRISPTKVNQLATEKPFSWFETKLIYKVPANHPGAGRRVYPGFLQYAGFVAMHPDKHLQSYRDFYLERAVGHAAPSHLKFYDEYNAVLDMSAEFYLDTIKGVFQEFELARGVWEVDGRAVRPQDITATALLTVEGSHDDICGAGQTHAAHALCSSIPDERKHRLTVEHAGHFGIFSGHRWHAEVCPAIGAFIRANSTALPARCQVVAATV